MLYVSVIKSALLLVQWCLLIFVSVIKSALLLVQWSLLILSTSFFISDVAYLLDLRVRLVHVLTLAWLGSIARPTKGYLYQYIGLCLVARLSIVWFHFAAFGLLAHVDGITSSS